MRLKSPLKLALFFVFPALAAEEDVLVTTDFVVKAGATQTQSFYIVKPANTDRFVMVGFNPVKALSVSCTLSLYGPSDVPLQSYNCGERQSHFFKTPLPVAVKYRAQIEVTNSNFTAASSAFSVTNRFKFVSSAD
jgi:hypothetical protein